MTNPILKTKITIPPVHGQTVSRARLQEQLNLFKKSSAPLLLVSAKAGSGKSSLVSEWLHSLSLEAAWLSLDPDDNDPERFLRYLARALEEAGMVENLQLSADAGGSTLPEPKILAGLLLEQCFDRGDGILLVLDDYHVIHNPWVHSFTEAFCEGLGQAGHLVIITRSDPPMPIARWRGRGQMVEIRDADLRFQLAEIEDFFNAAMGLDLSPAQLAVLESRTEGWIVGLQMAAITMQQREREGRLDEFIRGFGGTNRYILDYLMEEVLRQQSSVIQDFLIATSILDRFSADLCESVTSGISESTQANSREPEGASSGSRDTTEILRQLERANMFLVPLDDERQWFRYHHLFADLLRNELQSRRSQPEILRLHQRASRWFQANDLIEEAMTHALAAKDYDRAASIIEDNIVNMLSQSTIPRLLNWIERLPEHVLHSRPWIAVYRANTLAFAGQVDGVEDILTGVEKLSAEIPEIDALKGHTAAIRTYLANLQGDPEKTIKMAALSQEFLSEDHINARAMVSYACADACYALDDMTKAEEAFQDMLQMGESSGQLMLIVTALCELASVRKVQGQLQAAMDLYAQSWDQLVERNGLGTRLQCHYEFGLADLLYEWNQLDNAYEHAMTGMDIRSRLGGYYITGDVPLMRILQARGDSQASLRVLHDVERILSSAHVQSAGMLAFQTARVMEYLAVGDDERARSYSEQFAGETDQEVLARSSVLLAGRRFKQMFALVNPQIQRAREGSRTARVIALLCHRALAHDGLDEAQEANASIMEALSLARSEGFVRLFIDIHPQLARLIHRSIGSERTRSPDHSPIDHLIEEYAGALLAAFAMDRDVRKDAEVALAAGSQTEGETEALTERELEVLDQLAKGYSNKQIASQLIVAPSTIKQHLKNIYAKLDVHSRTEAVARARELNLLI